MQKGLLQFSALALRTQCSAETAAYTTPHPPLRFTSLKAPISAYRFISLAQFHPRAPCPHLSATAVSDASTPYTQKKQEGSI